MSEGLPLPDAVEDHSGWRPRHNPYLIALVVTVATFMEVLDTTIINVALPHIAGSLSVGTDESTWTLTSYLVANGIVLPVSGWLGRLMGRKNYFLMSIIMFTVSSLLCGLSTSLTQLICFRLMQGFFGGGLQPNQQSILLDTFEPAKRATAFGITAIAVIAAPVMGPTLGGWITDNFSWRWVFLINVPVGILATFAISAVVEDPPWARRGAGMNSKRHIDIVGLGLIAIGFACLQLMLDRGEQDDWFNDMGIRAAGIGALLGLTGAVVWLLDRNDPIVNLRVWKNKDFAIGTLLAAVMGGSLYGTAVLIPQLAETQLSYNATWSGLILSPGAVMILFMIPIITKLLMPNFQPRYIVFAGFASLGLAMFYTATMSPDINFGTLVLMRCTQTFGTSLLLIPISTVAFATVPREMNGDAAALYAMARNVGGSIGIALITALVTQRTQAHHVYLAEHLTALDPAYNATVDAWTRALASHGLSSQTLQSSALGGVYMALQRQASILGYLDTFTITGIVCLCIAPLAFLMKSSRPGRAAPAAVE